jgi:hypothetical protein
MDYTFEQLETFVKQKKNKLKYNNTNQNNLFFNNLLDKFILGITFIFLSGCLFLAIVTVSLTKNNYPGIAKVFYSISLLLGIIGLLLCTISGIYFLIKIFIFLREIPENSIKDVSKVNATNYYEKIQELSTYVSYKKLKEIEILFKIKLNKRTQSKEQSRVIFPLLSLFVVTATIFYFGISEEQLKFQSLYEAITGAGGSIAILTLVFQLINVFFNQDISVYNESLIILQEALIIAKERENSNHSRHQSDTVVLSRVEYEKLIEELEELEDIKAYDEAIAANDEAIPFEQAIAEIEKNRR